MELKQKIIIGVVVVATAFAAGRFSAPEKIKIEKQVVTVEKKVDDDKINTKTNTDRDHHKDTTVVEILKPDGTKETTTHTIDDDKVASKINQNIDDKSVNTSEQIVKETKEVTKSSSPVTISALGGIPLSFTSITPVWGASVSKPIIGPITIGAWGLSSREVGMSIGLEL